MPRPQMSAATAGAPVHARGLRRGGAEEELAGLIEANLLYGGGITAEDAAKFEGPEGVIYRFRKQIGDLCEGEP